MKKYSQLLESLKKSPIPSPEVDPIREAYVEGSIYNIGDKVKYKDDIVEIIDRGPNYVTLIKEGKTFKAWLKDVTPIKIEETHKRTSQLYKESFIIKGYKTKNFTRELSEHFKLISKSNDDVFALYNSVICLDNLLGMTEESLKEDYNKYKVDFDRAIKYFKKFDIKLTEMSNIEDMLFAFSLQENVKFNASDKSKVASIIAGTAGITETGDPVSVINASAKKFKSGSHTPEAWKIIGQMLNKATQAGIKWDKNIFAKSTLKFMGIEE